MKGKNKEEFKGKMEEKERHSGWEDTLNKAQTRVSEMGIEVYQQFWVTGIQSTCGYLVRVQKI